MAVAIASEPALPPFELIHNKDFDWRLVDRLKERLPPGSRRRYVYWHDGGAALVVALDTDQVEPLAELLGVGTGSGA